MQCTLSQNKCFRYWPELRGSREYGCVHVCNVAEYQAQGYCVRELQVWRPDQVSLQGNGTYRARVRVPRSGGKEGLFWENPLRGSTQSHWPCWLLCPSILLGSVHR